MLEQLQSIVEGTPGAEGAVLMGFDGIAVQGYAREGSDPSYDIESVAMELSLRLIELRSAAESLELGDLQDITLKAERGTVLVRVLSDEYFVAVILSDAAHFGKGRWKLRQGAEQLRSELE